jgi:subtilisin family serine protease
MRKIVLMRPHEWLRESYETANAAVATNVLRSQITIPGVSFSAIAAPVVVPTGLSVGDMLATRRILQDRNVPFSHEYVMSAEIADDHAVDALITQHPDIVAGVFEDPEIQPFPVICPTNPIGVAADVLQAVNISAVHSAGFIGTGVKVVIVDTGIDGTRVNVAGGINLFPGVAPGTASAGHGTMVALDASITAPNAMILDCPLMQSQGGMWVGFLSDAIRGFAEIMTQILQFPGPWVVVNSWGLYNRAQDAPAGNPQNYSSNPRHPFNQIVGALVGSGADVVFAAGNCGQTCPDPRCGAGDVGQGNSIHGASAHPDVVSIGAVTTRLNLLGYSSQGPGTLALEKPDVVAPSHFQHSGVYAADSGTSAACPVAAGVVASLRASPAGRTVTPARMRDVLRQTANTLGQPTGWNADSGYGLIDAAAALASLP